MSRSALLVTHVGRPDVVEAAKQVARALGDAGFEVRVLAEEAAAVGLEGSRVVDTGGDAAAGAEIVIVLGGDGTFLRAAELARPTGTPLLGVNLGRVGFLAETEPEALPQTVGHLVRREYRVEERLTLDVVVRHDGAEVGRSWALNEASLEKVSRERVIEVELAVDGRPLTSFGCDGVLCATPTGSTAYAFSAGGPVVWPVVEALLVVPNSAHALFARPLVIAPDSVIAVRVADRGFDAVLCCDGRRTMRVPAGGRVEVRRGRAPVHVVRIHPTPFSDRLVAKFQLPVLGFRDRWRDATDGGLG
ncbi:MAG: NAD kinase [Actinobacteria bacterium]|nr:NAD kinase [Actinomycetota bacterium]